MQSVQRIRLVWMMDFIPGSLGLAASPNLSLS